MSNPPLPLESFLAYVRAFNARNYDLFTSYYTPDVHLTPPDASLPPVQGVDAVAAHYRALHVRLEQTVVPQVVLVDRAAIFCIMDVVARSVADGIVSETSLWVYYDVVADGKISRLTCMTVRTEPLGVVRVEERVEECRRRADRAVLL